MGREISLERSLVVACDLPSIEALERLVEDTCDIEGLGGYKIGFSLALKYGLASVVGTIRKHCGKPVIYDHQKGGTDVPHTGPIFARLMAEAGVDYAILFPLMSPSTGRVWIEALKKEEVRPIVGAMMTIPDFLREEGGYLDLGSIERVFEQAASMGVNDFVLPGNKPEAASAFRRIIEERVRKPAYFLPGLGAQGGDIASCARVMGSRWHAIVGRHVYEAKDPRQAVASMVGELGFSCPEI